MMVNFTAPSLNFTYVQQHMIEFMIQGYVDVVGFFFWAIVFSGVIGYVYVKNTSAVSASVAILIIFAGFAGTNVFLHTPIFTMFFQIIVALSISGLVVVFFARRRG